MRVDSSVLNLAIALLLTTGTVVIEPLPITASGWDTLPGGGFRRLDKNVPSYYPDGKWPAYGWDSPANYHVNGKFYNDNSLLPSNIPRWYGQQDSTVFLGTAGYLRPAFYPDSQSLQSISSNY